MTAVDIAKLFLFVREVGGPNAGRWVEAIQRTTGNHKGDAWCASFVSTVLGLAHGGQSPLPMTASCDVLLQAGKAKGWISSTPKPGDVFLVMKTDTDAHHTGFVTALAQGLVRTIEGNTNPEGGREGYGVFERARTMKKGLLYINLPEAV